MNKTVSVAELPSLTQKIRAQKKSIVLVGGVFDLLHIGHIRFLARAKRHGDVLMILLESDARVRAQKGTARPFHTQQQRAEMLSALSCVDTIVPLPYLRHNTDYAALTTQIAPTVIALTAGDIHKGQKRTQAQSVSARLVEISQVKTPSTTRLAKLLHIEP